MNDLTESFSEAQSVRLVFHPTGVGVDEEAQGGRGGVRGGQGSDFGELGQTDAPGCGQARFNDWGQPASPLLGIETSPAMRASGE